MPAAKPKRPMPERRTRYEPPTLEEAIFAAQGLTDAPEALAEIAAQLTGLPEDEVKPEVLKAVAAARRPQSIRHTATGATVVVERRRVRVAMPAR
jgi:hypothetical protein